jgi:tetratricopeptide (TPR) repeat protein
MKIKEIKKTPLSLKSKPQFPNSIHQLSIVLTLLIREIEQYQGSLHKTFGRLFTA